MKRLLMALAFCCALVPAQARDWPDRDNDAVQTPAEFKGWAEERIGDVKDDIDSLDKRLSSFNEKTRRRFGDNVTSLRERVSKAEGRIEAASDRDDKDSWKVRDEVRDELKDIHEDVRTLHKRLDRR